MRVRKIVTYHGEGKTLFYIVSFDVRDPDAWTVEDTFDSRKDAQSYMEKTATNGGAP